MRYAGLIKNDMAAAPGLCVTFFTQGCPHHCPGCHNPETWDFAGGLEFSPDLVQEIVEDLTANGIDRKFCIMGGEPLCPENEFLTLLLITEIRKYLPETPVYIWTGYRFSDLTQGSEHIKQILQLADVLIDGPYIEAQRDTTLSMRGSSNQKIINLRELDIFEKI
jgi:anaerobic ribonucleoside-triphosphate reductase activating protein